MPPTPPPAGAARSSADVNTDIRALLERTRRQLSAAERIEFDGLVEEYEAARRAEMMTAA